MQESGRSGKKRKREAGAGSAWPTAEPVIRPGHPSYQPWSAHSIPFRPSCYPCSTTSASSPPDSPVGASTLFEFPATNLRHVPCYEDWQPVPTVKFRGRPTPLSFGYEPISPAAAQLTPPQTPLNSCPPASLAIFSASQEVSHGQHHLSSQLSQNTRAGQQVSVFNFSPADQKAPSERHEGGCQKVDLAAKNQAWTGQACQTVATEQDAHDDHLASALQYSSKLATVFQTTGGQGHQLWNMQTFGGDLQTTTEQHIQEVTSAQHFLCGSQVFSSQHTISVPGAYSDQVDHHDSAMQRKAKCNSDVYHVEASEQARHDQQLRQYQKEQQQQQKQEQQQHQHQKQQQQEQPQHKKERQKEHLKQQQVNQRLTQGLQHQQQGRQQQQKRQQQQQQGHQQQRQHQLQQQQGFQQPQQLQEHQNQHLQQQLLFSGTQPYTVDQWPQLPAYTKKTQRRDRLILPKGGPGILRPPIVIPATSGQPIQPLQPPLAAQSSSGITVYQSAEWNSKQPISVQPLLSYGIGSGTGSGSKVVPPPPTSALGAHSHLVSVAASIDSSRHQQLSPLLIHHRSLGFSTAPGQYSSVEPLPEPVEKEPQEGLKDDSCSKNTSCTTRSMEEARTKVFRQLLEDSLGTVKRWRENGTTLEVFHCVICHLPTDSEERLSHHIQDFHLVERKERDRLCRGCGENLEDVSKVGGHEDICNIFRPYRCKYCGKRFFLRGRQQCHEDGGCELLGRRQPCPVCRKSFSSSALLHKHMLLHAFF